MFQTLFYIPREVFGRPLFGAGVLLALWAVASVVLIAWLVYKQGFNADTKGWLPLLGIMGLVIWLVVPGISDERGLPIRGYGVMLLLGVVAGVSLALHRAERWGIDREVIFSLAFWMFVSGMVGARLFYVIEYWPEYRSDSVWTTLILIGNMTRGGLVVYGALLSVGLTLFIFVRHHRLPGLALGDLVAPSMALGLALGRLGCFLNGCCYGGTCDLPWSVQFPAGSPPFERQLQTGKVQLHGLDLRGDGHGRAIIHGVQPGSAAAKLGLRAGQTILAVDHEKVESLDEARHLLEQVQAGERVRIVTTQSRKSKTWKVSSEPQRSLAVHPAQLYAALDAGLLCLLLIALTPYRRRDGEVVAWMLTLHPISRFLLEIIRTDESGMFGTGLSISQLISLGLLALAAILWWYILRQPVGTAWPLASRGDQAATKVIRAAGPLTSQPVHA